MTADLGKTLRRTPTSFPTEKSSPGCDAIWSAGFTDTDAICRGGGRAMRIGSGSARSCCSRRPWRRSFRISSDFSPGFPRSTLLRVRESTTCFGCGRVWATTAGRGISAWRRSKSSRNPPGRFRTSFRSWSASPESAATRLAQSPRWLMTGPHPLWKPTRCASMRGSWRSAATSTRRRAETSFGTLRSGPCRGVPRGSSIRR